MVGYSPDRYFPRSGRGEETFEWKIYGVHEVAGQVPTLRLDLVGELPIRVTIRSSPDCRDYSIFPSFRRDKGRTLGKLLIKRKQR